MAEYDIADGGGREMLAQACAAPDRAEECAAYIARDGAVIHTKAGPKGHPAMRDELANRAFVCRTHCSVSGSTLSLYGRWAVRQGRACDDEANAAEARHEAQDHR